jgi:hypothetical protein
MKASSSANPLELEWTKIPQERRRHLIATLGQMARRNPLLSNMQKSLGVVERSRKRDIVKLVYSLVLSAGSDDSGVLADAMKRYNTEVKAKKRVVRGGFYAWLDDEMADLMACMVETAMNYAASLPPFLPGILDGVEDGLIFDSKTITLYSA